MSSQKGNLKKEGQRHQNKFGYKHNPKSKKTEVILSMPIHGLCQHCHSVLEWRKQFRKYKPLTAPKKCVSCDQKAVKSAYHVLCENCAKSKGVCAKCLQQKNIVETERKTPEELHREAQEEEVMLAGLRERERRAYIRAKEKAAKEGEEGEDGESDDDDDDLKGLARDSDDSGDEEEGREEAPVQGFKRLVLKGAPKKPEEMPAPVVVKKPATNTVKKEEPKDTKNYYDDDDDEDEEDEDEDEEDGEVEEDEEDEDEEDEEDEEEEEEEEEEKQPEPPRNIKVAKRRL